MTATAPRSAPPSEPGGGDLLAVATSPRPLLGGVLIAIMTLELLQLYLGAALASLAGKILLLCLPLLAFRALRAREAYLLAVAGAVFLLVWAGPPEDLGVVSRGLDRALYLAAFILLMGLLREGAVTSPAVLDCGSYVTLQPSRRRFLTVFTGSHLFSVLINLGALSLLAPIIQRGVRHGRDPAAPMDEISRVRERRQLSAALRGFAWFLVWAPTAVTQAVLPTLIPGIDAGRLIFIGLGLAAVMLLVSWAEDSLRWWPLRRRLQASGNLPTPVRQAFPQAAFGRLGAVCALLFGLTLGFSWLAKVSIVSGVMLAAPITLGLWVLAQQSGRRLSGAGTRLKEIATLALPGAVREAISLACAGFIGTLAAHLVPADQVAAALELGSLPGWLFLLGLSVMVLLGGQVALSPITMAVFLGSLVAELGPLPVDPTLAALAIAAGTAICTTGAPFASGTLMLARASGYSGVTLAWRWNLAYTLTCVAVLLVVYALLTAV